MRTHEAAELSAVMVGAHEQLALVLVAAGVAGRRLRGRRQSLEVELVRVPLPVYLRHDVFVVVVSEMEPAQLYNTVQKICRNHDTFLVFKAIVFWRSIDWLGSF